MVRLGLTTVFTGRSMADFIAHYSTVCLLIAAAAGLIELSSDKRNHTKNTDESEKNNEQNP